jgi:hypothetical protein
MLPFFAFHIRKSNAGESVSVALSLAFTTKDQPFPALSQAVV